MLTESEQRAVTVAVSRYGADKSQVQQAVKAVLQAHARGQTADLLELLVLRRQLTRAQAEEVRAGLDSTQYDLATASDAGDKKAPKSARSPAAGTKQIKTGDTEVELRNLGEYRILRRLGEGGMGSVYLGYQGQTSRKVAIKVLPDHLAVKQASRDRFYREAKSGALLNHPNIVRNLAAGQDQASKLHYLVLEYVDGPSAHALLNQFGRLSVADAVHIALDIARALEHAHSRSIVHRDIKPDNILLTLSGVAKLADLGLAKRTDETSHLTAARQGFGTPYYMPYEQAINARSADGRGDIYALGATLYHLLTGELPFSGATHLEIVEKKSLGFFTPASNLNPKVPAVLDRILARMLARNPGDRYQTASELIVDLERAKLASAVLSFVNETLALQDPLVRSRLTAPAQPTCPDLRDQAVKGKAGAASADPDLWYLKYRNSRGQLCKTRATTQQVVQRLREGRLPFEVEACHDPRGPFMPLQTFSEFQGELEPRPTSSSTGKMATPASDPSNAAAKLPPFITSLPWLLLAGTGVGLTLVVGLLVALLRG